LSDAGEVDADRKQIAWKLWFCKQHEDNLCGIGS